MAKDTTTARLEIGIPGTDKVVGPKLLADGKVAWPTDLAPDTGRRVLTGWVTSRDNPYFARNAVNRLWAFHMGTGLVEPLDDVSDANPASRPAIRNCSTT
jgi:hypothetical protein